MKTKTTEATETETATVKLTVEIPKYYLDFYKTISKHVDIGNLDFIAMGGIVGYLNALLDVMGTPENVCEAYPDIMDEQTFYQRLADKISLW